MFGWCLLVFYWFIGFGGFLLVFGWCLLVFVFDWCLLVFGWSLIGFFVPFAKMTQVTGQTNGNTKKQKFVVDHSKVISLHLRFA